MATTYSFSPVTATNRAGVVWVSSILSLMFSIIVLATRFQIKAHNFGHDDWLIAVSTLVALGQWIAIYTGLSQGLGQSSTLLSQDYARNLGKAVMASEILFLLAIMLSKLSVVFFMRRLFTREHRFAWWACHIGIALTVIWGFAGALGVSVDCGPRRILYGPERCPEKLLRWELVIGFDAALEVIYVASAVAMVWPLQMKTSIKITVVFAFAFRLISALFAAMHGVWIAKYVASDDPGLDIADVLVWQQVALCYSLIATTIPTLKNFLRGYNHAMGFDSSLEKRGLGGGYNLGSIVRAGTLQRAEESESGSRSHASRVRRDLEDGGMDLDPHSSGYRVGAFHDASRGKSPRQFSNQSSRSDEDPMIRRDISVTIEHERALQAASGTNSVQT